MVSARLYKICRIVLPSSSLRGRGRRVVECVTSTHGRNRREMIRFRQCVVVTTKVQTSLHLIVIRCRHHKESNILNNLKIQHLFLHYGFFSERLSRLIDTAIFGNSGRLDCSSSGSSIDCLHDAAGDQSHIELEGPSDPRGHDSIQRPQRVQGCVSTNSCRYHC